MNFSGLFHPLIRESKQVLQEQFKLYSSSDSILKEVKINKFEEDGNFQIHLNNVLTYYVNMSLSCRKAIANEEIIYDMAGKTIVNLKKILINYIE